VITLRLARPEDATALAHAFDAIRDTGIRSWTKDADAILADYIANPDRIAVHVALLDEVPCGLQSLKRSDGDNPWGVPAGWGIIGTHLSPALHGRGVGRRLFARSLEAARAAGLTEIAASISARSPQALGYYRAMGFRPDRHEADVIHHRYELSR
jgi:GNAT superfamily N-acetyltransferase